MLKTSGFLKPAPNSDVSKLINLLTVSSGWGKWEHFEFLTSERAMNAKLIVEHFYYDWGSMRNPGSRIARFQRAERLFWFDSSLIWMKLFSVMKGSVWKHQAIGNTVTKLFVSQVGSENLLYLPLVGTMDSLGKLASKLLLTTTKTALWPISWVWVYWFAITLVMSPIGFKRKWDAMVPFERSSTSDTRSEGFEWSVHTETFGGDVCEFTSLRAR